MNERTFHVLVVGPLRGSQDHAFGAPWTDPVRFERATFDEAMATVAPAIAIDVPVGKAKPERVELTFAAMRAFRPNVIRGLFPAATPKSAPTAAKSLVEDILGSMSSSEAPTTDVGTAVLAHSEVRNLERAWRGLHFLAARVDRDAVIVSAIAAEADEVEAALERVARRVGEAPIDLIVVDHALGSSRRDLDRLERWATLAEGIGAPLVANGLPELVGLDDLAALGRTQRRLRSSEDPRASALRSVAARDVTRWIALALNGAAARADGNDAGQLFIGPAFLVASLCAASFERTGWACAITGPTSGLVANLPVHSIDDHGSTVAIALEALATTDAAAEAAAAGLTLLAPRANGDVAILSHAPMLHRGSSSGGGAAPPASLGLVDQLFVARLAQAIVQLAAAIPADTPEAAAREVARVTLGELFGDKARKPEIDVAISGSPASLEVTVRPRGFYGVGLDEVTLGAPLAL